LAVVQGGGTTTLELTALRRPFTYFPLEGHFEQNLVVAKRLARHGAGERLLYSETMPEMLAETVIGQLGREASWPPIPHRRCPASCGADQRARRGEHAGKNSAVGVWRGGIELWEKVVLKLRHAPSSREGIEEHCQVGVRWWLATNVSSTNSARPLCELHEKRITHVTAVEQTR
jgi:hypothetical protein